MYVLSPQDLDRRVVTFWKVRIHVGRVLNHSIAGYIKRTYMYYKPFKKLNQTALIASIAVH